MFAENMSCEAGPEGESCLTQSLGSFTCSCFLETQERKGGGRCCRGHIPGHC